MKTLIVDDEPVIRNLVRDILLKKNLVTKETVLLAEDGVQGLELFKSEAPELVITDVVMPKLSGVEFIQALRGIDANTRVVVMSGHAEMAMALSLIKLGVTEFLHKPFHAEELALIVSNIFETIKLKQQSLEQQRQLLEMERQASLGTMVTGMAHEINNPNAMIRLSLTMLQKYHKLVAPALQRLVDQDDSDKANIVKVLKGCTEVVASALDASSRITSLIQGLTTVTRQGSNDKRPVLARVLVEEALTMVSHRTEDHHIVVQVPEGARPVTVNAQAMIMSFMNLIANAIDAMDDCRKKENRTCALTITVLDEPVADGFQTIEFRDTAGGMDEAVVKQLFTPFFTTKEVGKGTGLGLFFAKGNVENNGGRISCKSVQGEGTVVRVELPVGGKC